MEILNSRTTAFANKENRLSPSKELQKIKIELNDRIF
jgi:hypothetical protein